MRTNGTCGINGSIGRVLLFGNARVTEQNGGVEGDGALDSGDWVPALSAEGRLRV